MKGPMDLTVSVYQSCLLLLFNADASFTFRCAERARACVCVRCNSRGGSGCSELQQRTRIPPEELKRHLISLCAPKYRILNRSEKVRARKVLVCAIPSPYPGQSKDPRPDETFSLNLDYKSAHRRVRIPLVTKRSVAGAGGASSSASGGVPRVVEEDRKYMLDAATVRIMKARRRMGHAELVNESKGYGESCVDVIGLTHTNRLACPLFRCCGVVRALAVVQL